MRLCGSALHLPRVPADVTNHHRVAGRKPSETVAPKSVIQDRVRSRATSAPSDADRCFRVSAIK